ncbi:hypothetical protein EV200_104272 [Pedobacter psychrotolerans]|uniref:Uncharacterized protein n=1 Tax=Pedobacter psychrotolerans TaxID=1843235 RepID=A0A4V6NN18_9SPHI|nr:hypothetical protein EV200_104272 [Pedobacter psychrotolerans]
MVECTLFLTGQLMARGIKINRINIGLERKLEMFFKKESLKYGNSSAKTPYFILNLPVCIAGSLNAR